MHVPDGYLSPQTYILNNNINNWLKYSIMFMVFSLLFSIDCFAQMPLITDNSGTLGKGKGQLEISNGAGFHNEHRCNEKLYEISPVFTYGLIDKVDIVACYPFLYSNIISDTSESNIAGLSDITLEVKYQFYQYKSISFAVKPGLSIPSGNYQKELGSGKLSESCFLLFTAELPKMYLNGSLGYLRNENRCGDALNIWHVSVDMDYNIKEKLHVVLNTGIEKNPDLSEKICPVFGLIGFYYCINDNVEISLGYKNGITKAETNHAFVFGLTLRY